MIELGEINRGAAIEELTARAWSAAYGGAMWYPSWCSQYFDWQLRSDDRRLHVGAYDGDRLVGCFIAMRHGLRIGKKIWPISFCTMATVDPDYRSRGILPLMMKGLRDAHRELGLAFSLGVVNGERHSVAFRMWSAYTRAFPHDLKFLERFGLWVKVLDHGAMARAGLSLWERWGVRMLSPLPPLVGGRARYREAWRPYRDGDLAACHELVSSATADHDWALAWEPKDLAHQCGGTAALSFVADGGGGIEAVASLHRLRLNGRAAVEAAWLDLWAAPRAPWRRRPTLLSSLCDELRQHGIKLIMTQRNAMMPARLALPCYFLPFPAHVHLVQLFATEAAPHAVPERWSLLFR
jgi:GNAT superfamily N-acetyltransferase